MCDGIAISNLKKTYQDNLVLHIDQLNLELGFMYGLVGNNGVGKTTLLKIIAGLLPSDQGVLNHGLHVEMVRHESGLFQDMTVYENIFLNREYRKRFLGVSVIDWKRIKKDSQKLMHTYGLDLNVEHVVKRLDVSVQKLLEVIIALSKNPDVLVIDEPVCQLDMTQVTFLHQMVHGFMGPDKMTIYASHRPNDLMGMMDKIMTMRAGHVVDIQLVGDGVLESLVEFAERDVHKYPKRPIAIGDVILSVKHMHCESIVNVSLDLKQGELLGLVGLRGSHPDHIGKALFGAVPSEGEFFISGSAKRIKTTTHAVDAGVCYVGNTEEGMFIDDTVLNNMVSANAKRVRRLSRSAKQLISRYYLDLLNVGGEEHASMSSLSAGNKQKVLLAKWFFSKSKIFIFNKPTMNVDASSKVDIYNIILDLAESGAGILLISNDLEEIAGLCDRVMVIEDGKVKMTLMRKDLTVHRLVEALQNW